MDVHLQADESVDIKALTTLATSPAHRQRGPIQTASSTAMYTHFSNLADRST